MKRSIQILAALGISSLALFPLSLKDSTQEIPDLDYTAIKEQPMISIPAVDRITFKANSKIQPAEFYNPKENDCLFKIHLYLSDNTKIYESDYLSPDSTINEIELLKELSRGHYSNCKLTYYCYDSDFTPLNTGQFIIDIHAL